MEIVSSGTVTICGGSGGPVTIIGGYTATGGSGGTITTGWGATYMLPTWGCSMMGSVQAVKPHLKESLLGIECRCETKMLMRRGCNCGAMKAELGGR